MSATPNLDRARAAWGTAPDWVDALARACDGASQGKVAKRVGPSAAVINQVLGNSYKGRMDRVEKCVRGELMRATVICPVLGDLSTRRCLDAQHRPFAATNPLRVQLHQACKTCPNREDA